MFDSEAAFRELPEVDWSESPSAHIVAGDTVFLYGTLPVQALTHECLVVRTDIPFAEVIDDKEFWRDSEAFSERGKRSWMRLRLVRAFGSAEREALSLSRLLENGSRSAPQGRMRVPEALSAYMERVLPVGVRSSDDFAAERTAMDEDEVARLEAQVESGNYNVSDHYVTSKTRGSAQRAFARRVKANYEYRCAITGISTPEFLVASHIVPWSEDETIRLDPSNGICLSTLVDRAFDTGFLRIDEELAVRLDTSRLHTDPALRSVLESLEGTALRLPLRDTPKAEYVRRRNEAAS